MLQLDEMLAKQGTKIDKVLNFAIDDAILEERITGRWIHPSSGRSYHTKFAPPKTPGLDDVSHTRLLALACICQILRFLPFSLFILDLVHILFDACSICAFTIISLSHHRSS